MIKFFKKETVFVIATVFAIVSSFFAVPSISYIDFKTLLILFSMMVVVQFLKAMGIFDILVSKLLCHVKSTRQLYLILVFSCFFFSMLITNDICLLTFVPFSIAALKKIKREDLLILIITLQTVAANLGCMLQPFGAPHNIYLFMASKITLVEFLKILFPYWIFSFGILLILAFVIPKQSITDVGAAVEVDRRDIFGKTFRGVDYFLLLTFISFYILIGNLEAIPLISNFFERIIEGREILCGILASQIISNVPAAMMLSGFSDNFKEIFIGINIGGLGTLIASMANLISYKIYAHEFNSTKGKFLLQFTVINVAFLLILLGLHFIIG